MVPPRRLFRDFLLGRANPTICVATLPSELAIHIGARVNDVMMERQYAAKLLVKHRLTYEQLWVVQAAIDRGFCLVGKKPGHLEFIYVDDRSMSEAYILVIKSARYGEEVWLVTLHRTNPEQIRSKRRRQKLLRDHA